MVELVETTIYSVVVISTSSITTTKRTYWTAPIEIYNFKEKSSDFFNPFDNFLEEIMLEELKEPIATLEEDIKNVWGRL